MINKTDKILITGANGFLGKVLINKLKNLGYNNLITFRRNEYDLSKELEVEKLFNEKGPFDIVIHVAALVGGIGFNKENTGRIFYENIMMNTLIQEYSRRNNVKKFVGVGSVCAYPKVIPIPFKEEDLWAGFPEETNASYGLSKKMLMVQSQEYRKQYGFNAIHLLTVNLYGPGDNFNPESSHVIPALIKKFVEAKNSNQNVSLWGTGSASREFLYVDDAADAIIAALEKYDGSEPINLGSGMEISIKDLANKIANLVGFTGKIEWDSTKPDGQPRRALDVSKAEKLFGYKAKVSFDEGLKKTVDWYISQ